MSEQDAADADSAEESTDAVDRDTEAAAGDEVAEGVGEDEETAQASDGDVELDEEIDDALVDRVAESDPEPIAQELASLRTRVDGLAAELDAKESDVDELESKLKRKQADFQNYKKRMEKRRAEEKERAAADLVTRMLDVRDNLVRALDHDEDTDIRGGVESTLRQFDDVLAEENVEVIEPEPGDEVDPHRHEVLVRMESDQPEGTIAEVHRPGYEMADSVLREAQVTVSDGSGE